MEKTRFEAPLLRVFHDPLAEMGFHYVGQLCFHRGSEAVQHRIVLEPGYSYVTRRQVYYFLAGVWHRDVAALLGHDLLAPGGLTVGRSYLRCSFTDSGRDWSLDDSDTLEVLELLRTEVLPAMADYSDLNYVRREIESGAITRFHGGLRVLVAIVALQDGLNAAIAILDAEIAKQQGQVPGKWLRLDELRNRLIEMGGKGQKTDIEAKLKAWRREWRG
jgi:hypothetical protein